MTAFHLWKDYFQLAKVVEEMGWRSQTRNLQGAFVQPEQPPAPAAPSVVESGQKELLCSFCKHNGESSYIYSSHQLKDEAGRVQCPILRNYTCPQCGASKDLAHTRRFCPLTKEGYTSVYKNCVRNSVGKKKRHHSPKNCTG